MKYAALLYYVSLTGVEHSIDWLPCETAEQKTESLEALDQADIQGWIDGTEQEVKIRAVLEGKEEITDAIVIPITAENYPLYIALASEAFGSAVPAPATHSGKEISEIDIATDESTPLCDGGPGRKETLQHLRAGLKTIESIPATIESLLTSLTTVLDRLSVIESKLGDTLAATPAADVPAAKESIEVVDTLSDTPPGTVEVASPLNGEGNPPETVSDEADTQEVPADDTALEDDSKTFAAEASKVILASLDR